MRPHDWKRGVRLVTRRSHMSTRYAPATFQDRQKILKCHRCGVWRIADDDPVYMESKMQPDWEEDCDLALVRRVMES